MSDETGGAEKYDTREARHILARQSVATFLAQHIGAQRAASVELVQAVVRAADGAGYIASKDASGNVCISPVDGANRVVLMARDGVSIALEGAKAAPVSGLEYDPIFKKWIGVDDDKSIAPTAGEPIPRRSAVAVVAEAIAALIKSTP